MAKETTNITRYYDAVPPYCSALKISERKYESNTTRTVFRTVTRTYKLKQLKFV